MNYTEGKQKGQVHNRIVKTQSWITLLNQLDKII
jgi:hypothetical protein